MFEHNKFETLAIPFNLARTHARTHTPYPAIQYKGKSSMQKVKMRSFVFLLFLGNLLRFRGQKEKDDNEMKLKRTRLERILCTCAGPFPPFFRLCDSDCSGVQMRWGCRHQFDCHVCIPMRVQLAIIHARIIRFTSDAHCNTLLANQHCNLQVGASMWLW